MRLFLPLIILFAFGALSGGSSWAQEDTRLAKINYTLDRFEEVMRAQKAQETPVDKNAEKQSSSKRFPLKINGSMSVELARHAYKHDRFSKLNSQLILNGTGAFTQSLHYRISGRFAYDGVYDLGYYPRSVRSDQQTLTQLRDTYIDYSSGPWDLRLGKQQIVWGESAGLFVADVVNSKDFREFLLPDFDLIRNPEWGANLEYAHENFHSDFVFIPFPEFDLYGKPGSDFAPMTPVPEADKPNAGLENSKAGARFSYLLSGLDLGAFYLNTWTGAPVPYRTINGGVYDFMPEYKRLNIFGLTFSDEVQDTVFKGEFTFTPHDYFAVNDEADADGIERSDRVDYMLGINRTILDKINMDIQVVGRVIKNYRQSFINQKRTNSFLTLRLERDFLNHKLDAEASIIAGLEKVNFLYRPSIKYNITDQWQVKAGADLMGGDASTFFGVYRNASRYYMEVKRNF